MLQRGLAGRRLLACSPYGCELGGLSALAASSRLCSVFTNSSAGVTGRAKSATATLPSWTVGTRYKASTDFIPIRRTGGVCYNKKGENTQRTICALRAFSLCPPVERRSRRNSTGFFCFKTFRVNYSGFPRYSWTTPGTEPLRNTF